MKKINNWLKEKTILSNASILMIVAFIFMAGIVFYAGIDNSAEMAFMPLVEQCVGYEQNMDLAVILLQQHCLFDAIGPQKNLNFCDRFQLSNESSLIKLYNFEQ